MISFPVNSFSPTEYKPIPVVLSDSGNIYEFRLHKKKKYLLSNCFDQKNSCDALKYYLIKEPLKLSKIGRGGRNTGRGGLCQTQCRQKSSILLIKWVMREYLPI